jgi:hypothetical protein
MNKTEMIIQMLEPMMFYGSSIQYTHTIIEPLIADVELVFAYSCEFTHHFLFRIDGELLFFKFDLPYDVQMHYSRKKDFVLISDINSLDILNNIDEYYYINSYNNKNGDFYGNEEFQEWFQKNRE